MSISSLIFLRLVGVIKVNMKFYCGLHMINHSEEIDQAFISVNRLWTRQKPVPCKDWILDSGAFTEISKFGKFRNSTTMYAAIIDRLYKENGEHLKAVVSQDYMCEDFILKKTNCSSFEHIEKTVERYFDLKSKIKSNVYLMPVLQGFTLDEYLYCASLYGDEIKNKWVGVGSVCKRNANPVEIYNILKGIKEKYPSVKIHGFGLKTTCLQFKEIVNLLHTSDSMAWSFHARKHNLGSNSVEEAKRFYNKINDIIKDPPFSIF